MKKYLNKIIYIILLLLIIIFIFITFFSKKEYRREYNYFNKKIIVTIETNKKIDIFDKIDVILNKYNKLTDTQNEYEGINNLYFIRHNFLNNQELTLDKELIKLIKIGIDVSYKTNNRIDISKGNLYELFNEHSLLKNSPLKEEISIAAAQDIDDIKLKDDNIMNNHININLDYIKIPYVLNLIKNELEQNNITNYSISCDNDVIVGDKASGKYKIATIDPEDSSVLKIYTEKNKYISTTNTLDNIIDTKDKNKVNNFKSVTVITNNEDEFLYLSKYLFMLDINSGKKFVKNSDVNVIWYTRDNQIITN